MRKNKTNFLVNLVSIDNGSSHLSIRFHVIPYFIKDITRLSFRTRSENKDSSCGPSKMFLKKAKNYVSGQQEFDARSKETSVVVNVMFSVPLNDNLVVKISFHGPNKCLKTLSSVSWRHTKKTEAKCEEQKLETSDSFSSLRL